MDNPFQSPAILSLCTGMRGLERGIERAIGPVRTVAYVEIESFIIENLVRQMEQGVLAPTPVWSNLKTFPAEPFYGKVHGITGGYPCQPFSVAGERWGVNDPRHLWPYIFDIIRAIRPVWCFFENVPGHVTIGYREVRSKLQSIGYKIEQGIFSAEEVGAPHLRKRLFILAVGNTYCSEQSQGPRNDGEMPKIQKEQRTKFSPSVSGRTGFELDHTELSGLEGLSGNGDEKKGWSGQRGSVAERSLFPAKYGEEQMEWEHPRTIEPSLGTTINGYNFREDLLRMAGNGVVEQTAELAFRTLLKKHGL